MPHEAIIGIVFVVASAAAILVADHTARGGEAIKDILVGSLLWVTWPTIIRLAAVYAVIGVFHWILRRRFLTISFQARSGGRRGLEPQAVGFLVLPLVRCGDHLLRADRRRAAGVLLPGRARRHRVPVHPAARPAGHPRVDRRRGRLGDRAVDLLPLRPAHRPGDRVCVRPSPAARIGGSGDSRLTTHDSRLTTPRRCTVRPAGSCTDRPASAVPRSSGSPCSDSAALPGRTRPR